jgi:alkaline phosphatase
LDWLRQDLATTLKPVVVFAHQRLDPTEHYTIRNAEAVRSILERSGRVAAVFQGHSHHNDYALLNGIHYCTLVALVEGAGLENGGYGVLEIFPDHSLRVSGFRRQASHGFGRQGRA